MEHLAFSDLIDVNSLMMMQNSFSKYTGLALCVIDSTGNLVGEPSGRTDFCDKYTKCSAVGNSRCDECDRNAVMRALAGHKGLFYTCHAGMTDFVIPIIYENRIIGGILAGKVRTDEVDEEKTRLLAAEFDLDPDGYVEAAKKMKYISKERAEALMEFLVDFAAALSVIAGKNNKELNEMRKVEQIARSQSEFITGLTDNLCGSMKDWIDRFGAATEKYMNIPELRQETHDLLFRAGEVYSQIVGAVDYIRMTGGSVEFFESVYDVRRLIERVASSLEKRAYETGVTIGTRFEDPLPEKLAGNSGRIGQIINKLSGTLLNFTGKGGTIEISACCEDSDYSCDLAIRIKGIGTRMTEKAAAGIRAAIHGGGKDIVGGIGKLTSKDADFSLILLLLKQMSGNIEAESLVDGNVAFKITIPQLDGSKKSV